jgi:hypothetical protein
MRSLPVHRFGLFLAPRRVAIGAVDKATAAARLFVYLLVWARASKQRASRGTQTRFTIKLQIVRGGVTSA